MSEHEADYAEEVTYADLAATFRKLKHRSADSGQKKSYAPDPKPVPKKKGKRL